MIGKTISHYKILEKLGEGGMGVVYKAQDTKLKRHVALKFLPIEYTRDKEAKQRFTQEAQAAAALDHSNISNIYEIDETDDGRIFIAMACYEGETLKQKLEQGPLDLNEAMDITIQVDQGLARAHEAGIIHRDIKPANIIITKRGEVKIVDFGLAKLAGQIKITKSGTTMGTVAYMSPEQAEGEKVDHRSDIWSLGVVLYEMLTGRLPFKGEYDLAVIYSILNDVPRPISDLREDIPSNIVEVIDKCLKKNPEERFQTTKYLLMDLYSFQKVMPAQKVPHRPESEKLDKKKFKWFKALVLGLGGFLLLTIGIVAWYIYPFLSVPEPIQRQHDKAIAVLYFDNMSAEEDEYFADGLTEELISRLNRIRNLKVASRTDVRIYKLNPAPIIKIGEDLNVDFVVEGSVRKAGNKIRITAQLIHTSDGFHRWTETYDRQMMDIFTVQDDVAQNIASRLDIEISNKDRNLLFLKPTENVEAYDLVLKALSMYAALGTFSSDSLWKEMESMLKQAIALDPEYGGARSALAACNLLQFIDYYSEFKFSKLNPSERIDLIKNAEKNAKYALYKDPTDEFALSVLPIALLMQSRDMETRKWKINPFLIRKAKVQINRLVSLYPESPIGNLALGTYHSFLPSGYLWINTKREDERAKVYYKKALEHAEQILLTQPNNPVAYYVASMSYERLANISCDQDYWIKAIDYFLLEYDIDMRMGNMEEVCRDALNIGSCYTKIGEYDKALSYFHTCMDIISRHNNESFSILSALLYYVMGDMYVFTNQYSKASDHYRQAVRLFREEGNRGREALVLQLSGEVDFFQGDYSTACAYFDSSSQIWSDIDEKQKYLRSQSYLALALLKNGMHDDAKTRTDLIVKSIRKGKIDSEDAVVIYWNISQILAELGQEEKSIKFLEKSHNSLLTEANRLKEPKVRKVYLTNNFIHRDIVKAWNQLSNKLK